jgi:hypothetical protein
MLQTSTLPYYFPAVKIDYFEAISRRAACAALLQMDAEERAADSALPYHSLPTAAARCGEPALKPGLKDHR